MMKSTAFTTIFFCFLMTLTFGQSSKIQVDWAKTFGKGTDDMANDIIRDSDNNFVICGVTKPKGDKSKDLDVIKLDQFGKLVWGKKYGKGGNDEANCLVEAFEGGYVVAGSSSLRGHRSNVLGLLKLNRHGDQIWARTYPEIYGRERGAVAKNIINTSDRGYLVVGHTRELQSDAFVIKFNQYGEVEWNKTYGGERDDRATDILELPGGNLVLTGKTNSKGRGGYDLWFLKLDTRGRLIKETVYGGHGNESGESMVATRDGNILIAGETATRSDGLSDVWVLKLSENGSLLWDRRFGKEGEDKTNTIIKAHGGYLIGGSTNSIYDSQKAQLIKINESGRLVWEHRVEGRDHPKFKVKKEGTVANALVTTKDGGYVVAGNTGLFLMNKLVIKFTHGQDSGAPIDEEPEISFRKDEPLADNTPPKDVTPKSVPVESDYDLKTNIPQESEPEPVVQRSDVDFNIPNTYLENKNTYAVIIGNEDYTTFQPGLDSEVNVDFAENDARIFKKYAVKTLGIPEKNITLLINATYGQMLQAISKLEKLAEVSEGKAELLFYYAGHGLPHEQTKDAYLMPVDIAGTNIESGIKLDDLYSRLSKHKTERVTVFLDACFSGAGRNQGLLAMRGVKIRPKKRAPISGNMVVFSSSTGIESSSPYQDEQHGLFTFYLLKKLQETKGNLTYSDLSDYIYKNVRLESVLLNNKEQSPETQVSKDAENVWASWRF